MANIERIADIANATPMEIDRVWDKARYELAMLNSQADNCDSIIANEKGRYTEYQIKFAEMRLQELEDEISDVADIVAELELEYIRRGRWTRAFIVTNANGHIHSSMNCNTCFITTEFALCYQVSSLNESEIVELAGDMACTRCYPSAPINPAFKRASVLNTPEELAAKAARIAEKNARIADRDAKAIYDLDGNPLRAIESDFRTGQLRKGNVFKTDRAATNSAMSDAKSLNFYGNTHPMVKEWVANIESIATAYCAKHGIDKAEWLSELHTKAAKANAAEARKYAR